MSRKGALYSMRRKMRRRWKQKPGIVPWLMALPPRIAIFVLRHSPPTLSMGFVERLGRLAWLSARRRDAGRAHIKQAFPDWPADKVDALGKRSAGQMARGLAEALLLGHRASPATLFDRIELSPGQREYFDARLGKGTILVQGHFGAMEGNDGVYGALGQELMTPMRFPNNYYLGKDLLAVRDGWGVELVPRGGALRKMLRALRDGRAVMLASDQNAHHAPIFVPWFGRLAATDRAAAYLALRTGLPLVVTWCVRVHGEWRWRAFYEVVRPEQEPTKVTDEGIAEITLQLHQALEKAIRQHPEQYLWVHDRYRTRPPAESQPAPEAVPATATHA